MAETKRALDAVNNARPPALPATWRSELTKLVFAASALLTALAVASCFARLHYYFELLTHFRVHYAVCYLLAAIGFAVAKRWRLALLVGLAALLFVPQLAPFYRAPKRINAGGAEAKLRIAFANHHVSNRDAAALLAWLRKEKPDVVVLQEFSPAFATALEVEHGTYPHRALKPQANFPGGVGIYSRWPLEEATIEPLEPGAFETLLATVRLPNASIRLVSSHPFPPFNEGGHSRSRNRQLGLLAERLRAAKEPVVFVGDLNTSPWSPAYADFAANLPLINACHGFGIKPTWPSDLGWAAIPLDYCFVSPSVRVTNFQVGADIGSDHLPILVDLEF